MSNTFNVVVCATEGLSCPTKHRTPVSFISNYVHTAHSGLASLEYIPPFVYNTIRDQEGSNAS